MKIKEEAGNARIVSAIIAVIVVIIIVGIMTIIKINKNRAVETIQKEPYEYFNMYSLDEKVGVIDKKGNTIIESNYTNIYIPNPSKDVFFCFTSDEEYAILNSKGNDIFENYTSVMPIVVSDTYLEFETKVLTYEENGKYGLVNFEGKKVTDAIYEDISSLANKPGCIQVKKDGLYGVLDSEGKIIIDVKYNSIKGDEYSSGEDGYLKTGYIVSEKTNSGIIYGYIDYNGKVVISPKYEEITRALEYDTNDVYLVFMDKGKKGVIKNNKIVIKPRYQSINYYNNSNVFVVNKNGKYGFYEEDGKEILKPEYESYFVAGHYISVKKGDKSMLYDMHGNLVNTNTYKSMLDTGNPAFFIAQDEEGYYSIISKDVQIEDKYTNISYAFDNFFIFTNEEGKSGVLNVYTGTEIPAEYDYIILLENAKALEARKGNTVDIYSENIEKILTMSEAVVEKVGTDYTAIYSSNELKYIDSKGNIVSNTEVFKDAKLYTYQADDGKWGFKNKDGKVVVECKYDRATEVNEYGFAAIHQEGKWGVIDQEGNVVVVPSYELETYYAPKFVGKYLLEELETVYCTEVEEK